MKKKLNFLLCILLFVPLYLPAQQAQIRGKVIEAETGEPLPGVSILIENSTRGVTTDIDGTFEIRAASSDKLVFSFLGMESQTIEVGAQSYIEVAMRPAASELDEVTIVAFGKQKKESVIGAITTVNTKDLKVPSSNLTTALAGNMAGIIAYQRSGEPGADNADFFVRGITTFGANTSPLILIDNIELTSTDLARLQPDDIASFSIMKDATATALYGARGANGVILVTTKRGVEGPAKIFVRVENSISQPTSNIELADPVTFMKLHNEAVLTRNPLGELPYSQDKIENTMRPGSSPYIYPANDWYDMLFNDHTQNIRGNVSVTGGGSIARYYVAAAFSKDNGILKVDKRNSFNNNINFKNYNLRANVDIDITKKTTLGVRLSGNFDDYTGPMYSGEDVYRMVMRSNPVLFPAYYPIDEDFKYVKHIMFGNYQGNYTNPYAEMVRGYQDKSRSQMLAMLELNQDLDFITKGLSFMALMNISRLAEYSVNRSYTPFWYQLRGNYDSFTGEYHLERINENGTEYLGYNESPKTVESTTYTESRLNYANTFDMHSVSGLLVFTTREWLAANQGSLQLSLPSRNVGLAGRATYSFDSRYFAEFNFGYNGSERFAENNRWGFFPSAGVAWLISNESFWKHLQPTIHNLKLRYSYGLVGNDQIGEKEDRFFYLSQVNMEDGNRGAYFGENVDKGGAGIRINRYANDAITWETSTKQNYAVELGLWNKVNIIAEYFTEHRRNILMTRAAIPSTMGLQASVRANIGEASAHGIDIQSDYQHVWNKDFWTSARANFTWSTSQYKVYEEPEYKEYWRSRVGYSLNQQWGYIAERLFIDDAEARNSPPQMFGGEYGGGDIKYTDVNRDGQITPADMVPIGNPTSPEIIYGFGFSAGYKGFDASIFFQGLANESFWINTAGFDSNNRFIGISPFAHQTQLLKVIADSHWSENNQNLYAFWPRLSPIVNANNTQQSTWFMRDGSFLRLKQLEVGYTIPGKWQKQLHLNQLRVYFSGTNLLLFSKFKLWDVEMAGNGLGYPIQKVFNFGVNLTFN
ncbi:SusC/RagA family TonB-linked outer membrane protein [Proteiniphilum acetatigenes]|uniref:SusC/RagA family TonB-linked outer membrane protein n=1 Tax=Proteiniphilum acetatigenes TaxID=294710 RepID=UPI00037CD305|nr:TonB-dependent receptor [Proteiniphilum acetatigenes]SFL52869.1 TonB-linked outer membrane protein, SusC/RagA family [Porphyromonadaceae bacterium KH3CP3RA]